MTDSKCLTPGAIFHTKIKPREISVAVDLPEGVPLLSEDQAAKLADRLHDIVEAELAFMFIK